MIRLSSRNAWAEFYREHQGDPAKEYDFYQVIDKLEREGPEVSREKLKTIGIDYERVVAFVEGSRPTAELEGIFQNLSARGMGSYLKLDYRVIRGLAYYTGVVFEAF